MREGALITVIVTVYNKRATLKRALESVLEQESDFEYRILLIDDGSTDGSIEIEKEYEQIYPGKVRFICNKKNMGLGHTILIAYSMIETKYFAVLDADDYWINKKKIQKAISFLENNQDYSCYGSNFWVDAKGEKKCLSVNLEENKTASNVLEWVFLQTSASIFRNHFTHELLDKIKICAKGRRIHPFQADTFRNHLSINFGKQYYDNSPDSVYDVGNGNGIWSQMTPIERTVINMNNYYEIFVFLRNEFGDNLNSEYCYRTAQKLFEQSVDMYAIILKQHRTDELHLNQYYKSIFEICEDSSYDIAFEILKYEKLLR